MKRGVIDVLRRGLDDTIANWQLIALRVFETIVYVVIAIIAIIVMLVPMAVSIGLSVMDIKTPEDVEQAMLLLADKWTFLLWAFLGASLLILLFMALHSFVEAGCVRIYVDAEIAAGDALVGPRARYRMFSMERWMSGGTSGWWTVFWIYNLAWGVAGLILLIPLLPTALLMLVFRENTPLLIGTGCVGLVLTGMLALVVALVTGMWTNRAIVDWAVNRTGASVSLSTAWKSLRGDLARHVLVMLAMIVIGMAGSSFFGSFSIFANLGQSMDHRGIFTAITLPIRLLASIASTVFSAAITSWYAAAYVAIGTDRTDRRAEG